MTYREVAPDSIMGGYGYEDETEGKAHSFYQVICVTGGFGDVVKEVYYFNDQELADRCACYSCCPCLGGWNSVFVKGLDELPEDVKLNESLDWL